MMNTFFIFINSGVIYIIIIFYPIPYGLRNFGKTASNKYNTDMTNFFVAKLNQLSIYRDRMLKIF